MRNIFRYDSDTGDKKLDKRLVLNVGGVRHETWVSTLERLPGTRLALLAHLQEADENYDHETGEYFFDREPKAFGPILQFYRSEELHVDHSLCGNVFQRELLYWGLEEMDIEPCCWGDYSKYTDHKETLANLDDNFAFIDQGAWGDKQTKIKQWASRIWRFLEDPSSSRWAKVYAFVSMLFVATSILTFVAETHKLCQVDSITNRPMSEVDPDNEELTATGSVNCCCESDNQTAVVTKPVPHPAIQYVDYVCVSYFTFEIILRFVVSPDKLQFVKKLLNIIDFVCLLPHYAAIIVEAINPALGTASAFKIITMLRIVRVLRIFKLMKHYSAFKILAYTIQVSTKELFLMIVFLMSGVLMFASVIHFAEEKNFPNIPIAFWWALVTMTTVGYGDKYPTSYPGYILGAVSVICGVLVIAFTVPIVVNNFSLYYQHAQSRIKLPVEKRRKEHLRRLQRMQRSDTPGSVGSSVFSNDRIQMDDVIFRSTPASTPRDRSGSLSKQMNIRDDANHENNLDKGTKHVKTTKHGASKTIREADCGTPVEATRPPDMAENGRTCSTDSGFDDPDKLKKKGRKKHEEQTKELLAGLAGANRRFDDERKRQEYLIARKRELRAKAHQERENTLKEDNKKEEAKSKSKRKQTKDKS